MAEPCVSRTNDEKLYLKKVYRNIILLALFAHGSYILIFAHLGFLIPSVYNVGSVVFYCLMLYTTGRGLYRLSVTLIHIEVCRKVYHSNHNIPRLKYTLNRRMYVRHLFDR